VSELRTEFLVTNYARRKSGWSAFGHGFDTRRLHHETFDNVYCIIEGYLFLLKIFKCVTNNEKIVLVKLFKLLSLFL
jgi:hypothetical protein